MSDKPKNSRPAVERTCTCSRYNATGACYHARPLPEGRKGPWPPLPFEIEPWVALHAP